MRKPLFIGLILTVTLFGDLSAQIQHFTWQGVEREYLVRTPANPMGNIPVVFFLHGLGDNITRCDQEFNFSQMAEESGWAFVVPQARSQGVMGTMWNAGLTQSDIDDSGFLLALLDSLTVHHQLDPDSVFFTGFSMGGFMTHRMAIEHGDRITACAPVSGLIVNALASQTPVSPVRMLHIHGTNDPVVGYNGGSSVFGMTLGLSVDAIMDYWQNANGCVGEPAIDTLSDLKNDGLRFVLYTYNCGTDLQLVKVVGGIHEWYQSSSQYDVGYKEIIYDFFSGHGLITKVPSRETGNLRIWPNPTKGIINIQMSDSSLPVIDVKVYDVYGKMVDLISLANDGLQGQGVQIDLSRHPDGIYFVQVCDGAVMKVVVAR